MTTTRSPAQRTPTPPRCPETTLPSPPSPPTVSVCHQPCVSPGPLFSSSSSRLGVLFPPPVLQHTLPARSLLFCPAAGLPPIWEEGRSRLPLSWALGALSRAQMKGFPPSGDSRDTIILAGQPAAPIRPGSTGVATPCLHSCPAPSVIHLLIAAVPVPRPSISPSIPPPSVLMPHPASVLPGALGWGRRGTRPVGEGHLTVLTLEPTATLRRAGGAGWPGQGVAG